MSAALLERTVSGLHEALLAHVVSVVPRSAQILDVGCGTGAWLARLRAHGFLGLQGIDLDTRQFALPGVAVFPNDLNSSQWHAPPGRFQLITAIEVIEHLQNIENFFRNVHRLLDATGLCLITTPNVHSLHARLRYFLTADLKQFGRIGDPTHLFPLLGSTLARLAQRHGFELVGQWGYPPSGDAVGARPWVNVAMRALRRVLPEPIAGDVYCSLLRKA